MCLSVQHAGLGLGAWLALALVAAARQIEGPLDNDAYLPVNAAAEAELASGDQALAAEQRRAQEQSGGASQQSPRLPASVAWTAACETYRNALLQSRVGESVSPRPVTKPGEVSPWPDTGRANERYTEGVEAGVLWRLEHWPAAGRAAWSSRFDPLAEEALQSAGNSIRALERLERELPATPGAAHAALLLAEHAYERGELAAGRRWLERCKRHLALCAMEQPQLSRALELREQRWPRPAEAAAELWRTANSLEFVASRELEDLRGQPPRARALGSGPQAGLASLEGDSLLLQTPAALWLMEVTRAQLSGPFDNNAWLAAAGLRVEPSVAPGDGPGWRLDPASQGSSAVVVVGRTLGGSSNVLAAVDCPSGGLEPRLRWALAANDLRLAGSAANEGADDELEFQPGPLWIDDQLLVLRSRSRAAIGEREIELLALDPVRATLRWRSFLGKGGERVRDLGRFARRGTAILPAEPLLSAGAGIFASAQLGFGSLVDPLDGRLLYSVRNRRRPPEERGWTGWGAVSDEAGKVIAWAPGDADHLYELDGARTHPELGPLLGAPQPIGEAEALVCGGRGGALLLSRAGARRSLAEWNLASGSRQDGLRLGPEEVFAGRALASAQRVLAASDRALYLFDREHGLKLLATAGLRGGVPRGGNVWARGPWVVVLSSRTVEIFRAR